jgi:hypothetical protein
MVRPCGARRFVDLGDAVLHQCIRSLIGASLLRTVMDISAHATSLADRPQMGRVGHQCSHAPGRPILHLVSSSRRPRQVRVVGLGHRTAPDFGLFLCSCLSAVPSSRPALSSASRAGAVKAGRRADLALRAGIARPRLDGPERGARIKQVGPTAPRSWRTRRCALCGEPPTLCGRAC